MGDSNDRKCSPRKAFFLMTSFGAVVLLVVSTRIQNSLLNTTTSHHKSNFSTASQFFSSVNLMGYNNFTVDFIRKNSVDKFTSYTPSCNVSGSLKSRARPSYRYTFNKTFSSSKAIPRQISFHDHIKYMNLVKDVVTILDKHDIEYIMAYGTLLGSFMFHDMIPWDDDVDLSINVCDINRVRRIFSTKEFRSKFGVSAFHDPYNTHHIKNLEYDIDLEDPFKCVGKIPSRIKRRYERPKCFYKLKLFSKSSPDVFAKKGYPWRYPFVDFNFYTNNGDTISMMDALKNPTFRTKDFYPFHLRPFHDMWLPAVHKPLQYLKAKFKSFKCKEGSWDHIHEQGRSGARRPKNCSDIQSAYPYVRRIPVDEAMLNQGTLEELVLNKTTLCRVLLSETYEGANVLSLN